jgi:hypothetical protein
MKRRLNEVEAKSDAQVAGRYKTELKKMFTTENKDVEMIGLEIIRDRPNRTPLAISFLFTKSLIKIVNFYVVFS